MCKLLLFLCPRTLVLTYNPELLKHNASLPHLISGLSTNLGEGPGAPCPRPQHPEYLNLIALDITKKSATKQGLAYLIPYPPSPLKAILGSVRLESKPQACSPPPTLLSLSTWVLEFGWGFEPYHLHLLAV